MLTTLNAHHSKCFQNVTIDYPQIGTHLTNQTLHSRRPCEHFIAKGPLVILLHYNFCKNTLDNQTQCVTFI